MKYRVIIRLEIEVDPAFPTPSKSDVLRAVEIGVRISPTLRSITESEGISWFGHVGIPVIDVFLQH